MAHGVEIVEATQIQPSPLPHPPPPPVKLSMFDSFWMMLPPVQKLLLYSNPTATSAAEFSSLHQDLKSSLASVLSQNYLPLAGKLVHVASTGDVEIDLSDPSATFIEAESDLDLNQLATSETHDVRSFMKLVPAIDVSVLPFPVFAVQTLVGSIESIEESRLLCSRRTFVLNAQSIQYTEARPPSTFTVVSAYTWICFVQTKSFDPSAETANGVLMDCRTRLIPPLNEDYFGNCLIPNVIKMLVSELMGDDGLIRACSTMSEAIREGAKDPLGDFENLFNKMQTVPFDKMVNGTASPRFQVYEIDFGWGKL